MQHRSRQPRKYCVHKYFGTQYTHTLVVARLPLSVCISFAGRPIIIISFLARLLASRHIHIVSPTSFCIVEFPIHNASARPSNYVVYLLTHNFYSTETVRSLWLCAVVVAGDARWTTRMSLFGILSLSLSSSSVPLHNHERERDYFIIYFSFLVHGMPFRRHIEKKVNNTRRAQRERERMGLSGVSGDIVNALHFSFCDFFVEVFCPHSRVSPRK